MFRKNVKSVKSYSAWSDLHFSYNKYVEKGRAKYTRYNQNVKFLAWAILKNRGCNKLVSIYIQ